MKKTKFKSKKHAGTHSREEKDMPEYPESIAKTSSVEMEKVIHELHVHQIELEMQNEQLLEAEMEAREARQKYADLYDFAPVGYFTLDTKGYIIETNVTGATLLGAERRSLIKQPFHRFIIPEHLGIFQSYLQKTVELRDIRTCKLKLVRMDRCSFDALIETIAVINDDGGFDHYRSSVTDISEMAQVETALKDRTAQLEASNKELEIFSYSVAHDLRAPLRAIDGYARMILKKHGDEFDEDTLRKFRMIRSNAHMMGQLIDDLLTFSRLGRKPMSVSKIDMDQLVRDVWKELQVMNPGRNIALILDGIVPGYGDTALIKQVYFNLLSNAVKFTKYKDDAHIEAGGYAEGNENVYYVKDNGIGFDMAYYDKLFEVFQRIHSIDAVEGTGVGLALVKRAIEKHGGRVWAKGKPDEGSTFYFSLPSSHTQ